MNKREVVELETIWAQLRLHLFPALDEFDIFLTSYLLVQPPSPPPPLVVREVEKSNIMLLLFYVILYLIFNATTYPIQKDAISICRKIVKNPIKNSWKSWICSVRYNFRVYRESTNSVSKVSSFVGNPVLNPIIFSVYTPTKCKFWFIGTSWVLNKDNRGTFSVSC